MKLPYAKDIEEAVLAGMMVDSSSVLEAMPILKDARIFYDPKHQSIFKAIKDLYTKNEKIDMLTVDVNLKQLGLKVPTHELVLMCNKIGSAAHTEYHCRLLLQFYIKRSLIEKSQQNIQLAMDDKSDSLELLNLDAKSNDDINEIVFSGQKTKTYLESIDSVVKRVEMLSSQKDNEFSGVPTGFKVVDHFTGGWQNGNLIIVAARPAMGKTSLILKNAVACGLQNIPAAFFSLEMGIDQLTARTIAINSNLHLTQLIRDGFSKPKYFESLSQTTHKMKDFPLHIVDDPAMDILDILSKARILKRKHDIKIMFVDYIQLITDKTKGNNREQEIASISRNLKRIAKELDIPVIALSQLSRAVETRVDKRPKLSDLRESGAIEQDADIVTFLYRNEYYYPDGELEPWLVNKGANSELSFAKYRDGSLETIGLKFNANKAKYSDPQDPDQYDTQDEDDDVFAPVPKLDPKDDEPF